MYELFAFLGGVVLGAAIGYFFGKSKWMEKYYKEKIDRKQEAEAA